MENGTQRVNGTRYFTTAAINFLPLSRLACSDCDGTTVQTAWLWVPQSDTAVRRHGRATVDGQGQK